MGHVVIHPDDNVEVSLETGHKYARCDIKQGSRVMKYGYPIGIATADIEKGAHVHTQNLVTALSGEAAYDYAPIKAELAPTEPPVIQAYVRENGSIGIRNDVWIINTVGCINHTAEILSRKTGALCFTHPYGCSQLGDDLLYTQRILCGLIHHPNAGGVLVLGLGCENNRIDALKEVLGTYDKTRVRFLNIQDCEDEIAQGTAIIKELQTLCASDQRTPVSASRLIVGLKCGGSDGLSGITANPLVGKISDRLISFGASCVLTEVPEMFGAEQLLLNRCSDRSVFDKAVAMLNGFRRYYLDHGLPVSENPSPGNREGGITTLEEKSLGCVLKGGSAPITDVLHYGETVTQQGLSLLNGPGNDMVAATALTASGCHLILFTTGRGTPLGAPVPTVKIASNTTLAQKKKHWIDYDAQTGNADALLRLTLGVADGALTKNEMTENRGIAIFKNGVTL